MPGRLARVLACVVLRLAVAAAVPLAAQIGAGALAGDIVDQAGPPCRAPPLRWSRRERIARARR